ncbi:uncharacterized protein At4g04775-like [Eutrema salsugineum]|uniref:uncharacterized protein At4g04775-like n=1 Tax=Eutrema salsugineum TaxID=72664 RepID=UPI000CED107A|nr:uncharacterized protein At4g04775-like [Eutrema salsugineum]
MSHESGASSGTSYSGTRGRGIGVPRRCWCGDQIVAKISKSDANPYRRYYRCAYAVAQKLTNDKHDFKWVDEALLNEIEALGSRAGRLEDELKQICRERMELEKMMFEKMQMKLEQEIFEKVEEALLETKSNLKKMMAVVCFGCLVIVCCSKLVG